MPRTTPRKKKSSPARKKKTSSQKKKVDSQGADSSQSKAWWYLAGAVVVVILIIASLLVVPRLLAKQRVKSYNYFDFVKGSDGLWYVDVMFQGRPYTIVFHYHPSELEDVRVQPGVTKIIDDLAQRVSEGKPARLFITLNPDPESNNET